MTGTTGRPRLLFVAANPSIDRLYEVDRLVGGAIHRPAAVIARPGGKGLNAARAAASLSARVTAVGIVAGWAGEWIVDSLAAASIDARMARSTGETRTCVSILDRSTGSLTELYEPGEAIGPDAWATLEAIVVRELDRGDAGSLAFSGSLPPGAPTDGYARIARIASGRSVPVLADAYGPVLAAVLAERPAVVKVNASEAGEATGLAVSDPRSAAAAARALVARGAACVVVTLGVDGAVIVTAHEDVFLVPPDVRGSYPVGSGDAFLGGLAVALGGGEALVEAARRGMAAAIANALVPGAGDLDPSEAERLFPAVAISRI